MSYIVADKPDNENERLETLRALGILDTKPEERFDRIVNILRSALDLPIAIVSLVDADRQWFKAKCGIDECETDRSVAFCAHTILQDETFLVPNALEDERFRGNPLVQGEPFIRSYIGTPLTLPNGCNVGTLCAIDMKPRKFSYRERRLIESLAGIAVDELTNNKLTETIGELNKTTRQLREMQKEAESAVEAKNEFLAKMSHEIRTPLNGLNGFLGELAVSRLDPEQQSCVNHAVKCGDHLMALIGDILDFSEIEADNLVLESATFDPGECVQCIREQFSGEADKKRIDIVYRQEPEEAAPLMGDPKRFKQILYNLVSNAIKFTPRGGVYIDLDIEPEQDGWHLLRLTVRDTGIGIAQDKLEGIFNAFEQVSTGTTRDYGGTGLGLAITAALTENMGGSINAVSHIDLGSSFSVQIPFKSANPKPVATPVPARAPEPVPVREPAKAGAASSESPLKMLMADDSEINRELIKVIAKRMGLPIDCVENGEECVEAAQTGSYDIILMDVEMPVMGGIEAAEKIGELGLEKPPYIIALTAHVIQSVRDKCSAAGMKKYLAKPISYKALQAALLETVEESRRAGSKAVA